MNAVLASHQTTEPHIARMTEPFVTRVAVPADRDAILELHHLSLRTLGRGFYDDLEIESYLRHAPTLEDYLLEDGTYYLAHARERLVGCGGWSLKPPAYNAVTQEAPPAVASPRVRAMFVHPDFARRGIGRLLLADIERAVLEKDHREILIDATLGGLLLYERCGYRRVGQKVAALPDGASMHFVSLRKSLATR